MSNYHVDACESIARRMASALCTTTSFAVDNSEPAGSKVQSIRDAMRAFDRIRGTATGGSTSDIAARTALQVGMATAFASVAAAAVDCATLAIAVAALTP